MNTKYEERILRLNYMNGTLSVWGPFDAEVTRSGRIKFASYPGLRGMKPATIGQLHFDKCDNSFHMVTTSSRFEEDRKRFSWLVVRGLSRIARNTPKKASNLELPPNCLLISRATQYEGPSLP